MQQAQKIIRDVSLDYPEKRANLATAAESALPPVPVSRQAQALLDQGVLCDLKEGPAPYRPRYVLPDYGRFLSQGSDYLGIAPPQNMFEAVGALMALYRYVPSITGYPVYLGQADELLEPFCDTVSPETVDGLLRMFLLHIDRTLPDAFVHMNIGPSSTNVGRAILGIEKQLGKAVPNLSLKLAESTPDDFAAAAVETALSTCKPYFVNHDALSAELGSCYGIASCYNTLRIGGGSHTLVRLNLKAVAQRAASTDAFFDTELPEAVACLCEVINARASFVVEKARFFLSSFLAREGLISLERFTSMAGIVGLYEAVTLLSDGGKMGHDPSANALAERIVTASHELIKSHIGLYCKGLGGRIGVHAQAGLNSDVDITPGARIKNGCEPELFDQLRLAAKLQRAFDTGANDICVFDRTARDNVAGVLRIVRGAMAEGVRILSIGTDAAPLVRVSGYLVKRSDVTKYREHKPVREQTVGISTECIDRGAVLKRRVRPDASSAGNS